ncbi:MULTISPECIES: sigma-70 family RNA polymerase sigma factor [unclassified Cupriavidus]|uniref:sigma-70 family RNA polymerase sigma factor n=1 Tax=unclassified Cupriavidus TaxID=2640874 RepID=UPI001CEDB159|nr:MULTISPECIES: sigma-70 family RNA polymerase sigma factor [unclassified Cupriavidus]
MALPSPLPDDPDPLEALLGRVAIGDRQALRAVYDLSAAKLFGLALRITRKRDLAEDVVQESFVSIWHHAGDYRPQLAAPMTWMTTIVRNRALDALRRTATARLASATPLDDAPESDLADTAAGPAELAQASQQARALNRCLQRLEHGQRQAIMLAYLQDMSHSELAERMHAPLGTIKSWIRRGLERLRACLESTP